MKDEPQNTNIDLKAKTANTLMWNTIDRISTQILYAVTGIVLAQVLMPEDFGLIGAITIFTAFANLFIDSGFQHYFLFQHWNQCNIIYSFMVYSSSYC